jgi:hypothetical protein
MLFSPTIYLQKKLESYSQKRIINGFFKGLKYETGDHFSFDIIAGTYEKELFSILNSFEYFDVLIDVGAGDGYYVVGLLNKFKHLKCYAYEQLGYRKERLLNNLLINNIDKNRWEIYDSANIENLKSLLIDITSNYKTLIIMDVEGYEKILLNLDLIPQLEGCTILVEVHEHLEPGVTNDLKNRFKNSHHNKIFTTTNRTVQDVMQPFNRFEKWLFRKQLERLLGEGRFTEMEWFYLEPKSKI